MNSGATTLGERLARAGQSPAGFRFLDAKEQPSYLSFGQLDERARQTAGALADLGVQPGDRVALILPTGPEFFEAFFGAVAAGAVPVPLYPPVRLGRLAEYHLRTAHMLQACGALLVLTDARIRRVLGPSVAAAQPRLGCVTLADLSPRAMEPVGRGKDDLAFVQFSSGTTREPMPVALTHAQVAANVDAILEAMLLAYPEGPDLQLSGVSWLPLYHDMGLVGCALVAISQARELTLIPPELFVARPAVWLRAISTYRASVSPAPNFAYALCAAKVTDDEIRGIDLSTWRVALNGAEPVTHLALERFVERFTPYGLRPEALTPVYGLAEATLAVTFTDLRTPFFCRTFDREQLLEKGVAQAPLEGEPLLTLVPAGRALPGFDVRIVAAEGEECPQSRAALPESRLGRVLVRGPSVMSGYLSPSPGTDAVVVGGWLDTGDTGFVCDEQLYIYGRVKDLIILSGRKYAPQPIEQAAEDISGARAGCVAAVGVVPEGEVAEVLLVLVERARGNNGAAQDIELRVSQAICAHTGLVPWRVQVVEPGSLPRTSSGKIRRGAARDRWLAGRLTPPTSFTLLHLLAAVVRSSFSFARLHLRRAKRASHGRH